MHHVHSGLVQVVGNDTGDVLPLPLFEFRSRDNLLSTEREMRKHGQTFNFAVQQSIYLRFRAAKVFRNFFGCQYWINVAHTSVLPWFSSRKSIGNAPGFPMDFRSVFHGMSRSFWVPQPEPFTPGFRRFSNGFHGVSVNNCEAKRLGLSFRLILKVLSCFSRAIKNRLIPAAPFSSAI